MALLAFLNETNHCNLSTVNSVGVPGAHEMASKVMLVISELLTCLLVKCYWLQ